MKRKSPTYIKMSVTVLSRWVLDDRQTQLVLWSGLSFVEEALCGKDGSISALAPGAFQFCPGVDTRRSKSMSLAQLVSLRFGICSERSSGCEKPLR